MPRYFLEIAFDGTPYRGWQRQPAAPSVQEEVERALRLALHLPKVNAVGCGRTDTGVHASSYFLHFDVPETTVPGPKCHHSLNGLLPPSIAVKRMFPVGDQDHARFSATERGYTYHIHRLKDPFLEGRSYLLHPPLDVAAMNEACRVLVGRQDFSSFQRVGSDNRTAICDVREARWSATDAGYAFTITADRFLRNMVRAIVGTCLLVGKGQQPPAHMGAVLAARDRAKAGKSAPARGLYLARIVYPFVTTTSHPGAHA